MSVDPWWANGDDALEDPSWDYYEANALPIMRSMIVAATRSSQIAWEFLHERITNKRRFRGSQLLHCLLQDLGVEGPACANAVAAVELLLFARLMLDDVVDEHEQRWGLPTLHILLELDGKEPEEAQREACQVSRALQRLATRCGEAIPENGQRAGESAPTEVIRDSIDDTLHAMTEEWRWSRRTQRTEGISWLTYESITLGKHGNGSLCAALLPFLAPGMAKNDWAQVQEAARFSDLAGGVANDITEAHRRRGHHRVRVRDGENRGPRTEIELGRPSIFDVYLSSDDLLQDQDDIDVTLCSIGLRDVAPDNLMALLHGIGAVTYAEGRRRELQRRASEALPERFEKTREWILNSAKSNLD